jgi:serine/threonine protein phosphatase 1
MTNLNFLRQRHFTANLSGRDFVCGDIHGSYSCVERFLEGVNFDKSVDRLFCVGDLVDRGPQNEECLTLLLEPWFFSVYANHEELMYEAIEGGGWIGNFWFRNGGNWAAKYLESAKAEAEQKLPTLGDEPVNLEIRDFVFEMVRDTVANLPHIITVEKRDGGRFHVLHAELPKVVGITDAVLADPDRASRHLMKRDESDDTVNLLWSRQLFGSLSRRQLDSTTLRKAVRSAELSNYHIMFTPQLSHIYSGHTIVAQPLQFYGQTNLDTMAYGSYYDRAPAWAGLSVTEPATGKFWLVNDREFKEVEVLVVA